MGVFLPDGIYRVAFGEYSQDDLSQRSGLFDGSRELRNREAIILVQELLGAQAVAFVMNGVGREFVNNINSEIANRLHTAELHYAERARLEGSYIYTGVALMPQEIILPHHRVLY